MRKLNKKLAGLMLSIVIAGVVSSFFYVKWQDVSPAADDTASFNEPMDDDKIDDAPSRNGEASILVKVASLAGSELTQSSVCTQGISGLNQLDKVCALLDEDGDYQLTLSEGKYRITVSALHHASISQLIVVVADELKILDFGLELAAPTLSGRIKSASGKFVSGAKVGIYGTDNKIYTAVSDENGKFSAWAPSQPVRLQVAADGYGLINVSATAPSHDVVITLFPGFSLSGKVIDVSNNQPLSKVRVVAAKYPGQVSSFSDPSAMTDDNGRFEFTGLKVGEVHLSLLDQYWTSTKPLSAVVDINNQHGDYTLYAEPGAPYAGVLKIEGSNNFCKEGSVLLSPLHQHDENDDLVQIASVTIDGLIQFPALPMGDYQVIPQCAEHTFFKGPVEVSLSNKKLVGDEWSFAAGLELDIYITDKASRPVNQINLVLKRLTENTVEGEVFAEMRRERTDVDGRYKFGGLEAGQYLIEASVAGISSLEPVSKRVDIFPGKPLDPVNIMIDAAGGVEIYAHTEDGAAVSRLFFHAKDSEGGRYEAVYHGAGIYRIAPLPLGQFKIFGYDNKNPKVAVANDGDELIFISDSTIHKIDFRYRRYGGVVQGSIRDQFGNGMANTSIRVVSAELDGDDEFYSIVQEVMHGNQSLLTDSSGEFFVDGLNPDSRYEVYVSVLSGLEIRRDNVVVGDVVNIQVPAAATLEGRVVDKNNKPLTEYLIELKDADDSGRPRFEYVESEGGVYKIDNLTPGAKKMLVTIPGTDLAMSEKIELLPGNNYKALIVY